MAKRYTFPITVAVVDPETSVTQLLDKDGRLVRPASVGIRHVPPGEPVEMDEAEAKKLYARHGPYKKVVTTTETEVPALASAPVVANVQGTRRP